MFDLSSSNVILKTIILNIEMTKKIIEVLNQRIYITHLMELQGLYNNVREAIEKIIPNAPIIPPQKKTTKLARINSIDFSLDNLGYLIPFILLYLGKDNPKILG